MDRMRGPVEIPTPDRSSVPHRGAASTNGAPGACDINRGGGVAMSRLLSILQAPFPGGATASARTPAGRSRGRGLARAIATVVAVVLLAGAALLPGRDAAEAGVFCIVERNGYWAAVEQGGSVCDDESSGILLGISDIPAEEAKPAFHMEFRNGRPQYVFSYNEDNLPGVAPTTATTLSPANRDVGLGDSTGVPPKHGRRTPLTLADGVPLTVVYKADADHRTVEEDGEYYREWRDNQGNWRRSGSYGTGDEGRRRASWNTFWRSQGEELLNPHDPRADFPGSAPQQLYMDPVEEGAGGESAPEPTTAQAVDSCVSPHENPVQTTYCPNAPSMTATPGPNDGRIRITWTPASGGRAPTYWQVGIRKAGSASFSNNTISVVSTRSYTFFVEPFGACYPNGVGCGLTPGADYDVQVRGVYTRQSGNQQFIYYGHPARASGVVAKGEPTDSEDEELPGRTVPDSARLVGNSGQTKFSEMNSGSADNAQAFTTGSHESGYKLTSVTLVLTVNDGALPTYKVSIRSNNSSGEPGTLLATLANPPSPSSGQNTYTAPGAGIDLEDGTIYWLVIDVTTPVATADDVLYIDDTNSNAEDSGGLAGWSIADSRRFKNWSTLVWSTHLTSLKIEIHGYAKP